MIWRNDVVGRAFYSPCSCPFLKVSWDLGLAQIPRDFESWWQFSRHVRILDPIISLNHFNLILSLFFLGRIPVQSFAARITQLTCYSDTHQITYWLSLCSHNQHKVLVPIYKALHGLATFVSLFCNISLCSSPIHYPLLKVSWSRQWLRLPCSSRSSTKYPQNTGHLEAVGRNQNTRKSKRPHY